MRPRHGERGSAVAEFAVASTVVLIMLLGTLEAGRAIATYHLVANAARIGSRYAIVHGSTCSQTLTSCSAASSNDIQTYVRGVSPGVNPANLSVAATWSTAPACINGSPYNGVGCIVTVTVNYRFHSVVPLLNFADIPMKSTSAMIISQ